MLLRARRRLLPGNALLRAHSLQAGYGELLERIGGHPNPAQREALQVLEELQVPDTQPPAVFFSSRIIGTLTSL